MPEYLAPGVFIEEFEIGPKPIEGVATGTAAFLGETERGPVRPTLVTSWSAYVRLFGGVRRAVPQGQTGPAPEVNGFLPHAVRGFFDNGGRRCYVNRVVHRGGGNPAQAATLASRAFGPVTFSAVGEGAWGRNIRVAVSSYPVPQGATEPERPGHRIVVEYWRRIPQTVPPPLDVDPQKPKPDLVEVFDEVVVDDAASQNYIEKRLREGNSALVTARVTTQPPGALANATSFLDTGGVDGAAVIVADFEGDAPQLDQRRGLRALEDPRYDEIALLYAPNASAVTGLPLSIIGHCERHRFRFAALDCPPSQANADGFQPRAGRPNDSARETQYAAYYYPWIEILEPETSRRRMVPPGGHVLGIYSRTDNRVGVWKAPANEVVRGAVGLEFQVPNGEQEVLNPRSVNVIRSFESRGIRVWGARSLASDPLWRYISVRRLFIYLEASIFRATQWVVFEVNNERLWARVEQTVRQFLRGVFRDGALLGEREEEAFFVRCDRSVMSPDDIDNGRLVCEIGVSPARPAEFVIFRVAQLTAGSSEE